MREDFIDAAVDLSLACGDFGPVVGLARKLVVQSFSISKDGNLGGLECKTKENPNPKSIFHYCIPWSLGWFRLRFEDRRIETI